MTKFKVIATAAVCAAMVMSSAAMASAMQNGQGKGPKAKEEIKLMQQWEVRAQSNVKLKGGPKKDQKLSTGSFKAPVYKEGRILIPINAITMGLGATVTFNEDTVRIAKDGKYIEVNLKDNTILVNGTTLDVSSIKKGRGRIVLSPGLVGKLLGAAQSNTMPSVIAEDISMSVGEEKNFTVSATNPESGKDYNSVLFRFSIPNTSLSDIDSFQYKDGSTWRDVPLSQDSGSVTGYFGPSSGFAMPADYSATTDFRLKMDKAGTYSVNIRLVDLDSHEQVLARDGMKVYVDSALVSFPAEDLELTAGVEKEFTVSASNSPGNTGYDSVRYKFIVEGAGLNDVSVLRYKDGDTWRNISLARSGSNVVGYFGPSAGFSFPEDYSDTTALRLKMAETGTYNVEIRLVDLDNNEQTIARDTMTVTVDSDYSDASITAGNLTLDAGVEKEFTVSAANPENAREYDSVLFKFRVEDAKLSYIPAFRYRDGQVWRNMPLSQDGSDVVGYYGPSSGFSLPEDYSATTTFSLNVARVGTYNVEITLVDLDDNEKVIARDTMTVRVD
ncbi:MAG: copper amine oxidase N-terminal domain-containing protein [Actinobacteria bacterium]|nr:copper amine oxidase N-terminal domain-containing protein [Actinomycetota bacterium]